MRADITLDMRAAFIAHAPHVDFLLADILSAALRAPLRIGRRDAEIPALVELRMHYGLPCNRYRASASSSVPEVALW